MLAVTTRNRLRSARFCLPMLRARWSIARQLGRTPGLVRYASGIAGPTEFLTLTVWEDKSAMRAFMQSGAHERFMWLFTRWTASFWAMRWEPSEDEVGAWGGIRLTSTEQRRAAPQAWADSQRPVSPLVAAGLLPLEPPRAGPTGPRPESGPVEPRSCGLFGLTAVLAGPSGSTKARVATDLLGNQTAEGLNLVRWAVGLDWPPQALVISLWRDSVGGRARALDLVAGQLGSTWAMCWQPGDYEIGHWDGMRLRQAARLHARTASAS